MFELSLARNYLIPRRKQLTMSLIAIMSVGVITLVVWLVLLFLSVLGGIEKGWLTKLTAMHGPVRVTPKEAYYHSHYYQIDSLSNTSNYSLKSLGEKLATERTNPYLPDVDASLPPYFPQPEVDGNGELRDLAKEALETISDVPGVTAHEYATAGALMRLRPIRFSPNGEQHQGMLTQATYLTSIAEGGAQQRRLIEPITAADIEHLAERGQSEGAHLLSDRDMGAPATERRSFQTWMRRLLAHTTVSEWRLADETHLPHTLISEGMRLRGAASLSENGSIDRIYIEHEHPLRKTSDLLLGELIRLDGKLMFNVGEASYEVGKAPLELTSPLALNGTPQIEAASSIRTLFVDAEGEVQGERVAATLRWGDLTVYNATCKTHFDEAPEITPLWPYYVGDDLILPEGSVILPAQFRENGIRVGDSGYFSYGAASPSSIQEQRLDFRVAAFYNPGTMAIGPRAVLAQPELVRDLGGGPMFDATIGNGFSVWFDEIERAPEIASKIGRSLFEKGLAPYFSVTSFHDYDFAKDLLQQFQSDRYLFTLVAALILLVACTNIISLLILLVNDKRKEIGILRSMGASKRSIAATFALCGGTIGCISMSIGIGLAWLTLANIDSLVSILSAIQGKPLFNSLFYGEGLPRELGHDALLFIAIATPLLSLIAGLVPALKACRIEPAETLRAE